MMYATTGSPCHGSGIHRPIFQTKSDVLGRSGVMVRNRGDSRNSIAGDLGWNRPGGLVDKGR